VSHLGSLETPRLFVDDGRASRSPGKFCISNVFLEREELSLRRLARFHFSLVCSQREVTGYVSTERNDCISSAAGATTWRRFDRPCAQPTCGTKIRITDQRPLTPNHHQIRRPFLQSKEWRQEHVLYPKPENSKNCFKHYSWVMTASIILANKSTETPPRLSDEARELSLWCTNSQ
jgi:hypothetical protein